MGRKRANSSELKSMIAKVIWKNTAKGNELQDDVVTLRVAS